LQRDDEIKSAVRDWRGYGHLAASRVREDGQILRNRSFQISGGRQPRVGPVDEPGRTLRLELVNELDRRECRKKGAYLYFVFVKGILSAHSKCLQLCTFSIAFKLLLTCV